MGLIISMVLFQSTLPVKGATDGCKDLDEAKKFQSTLPVKGATTSELEAGHNEGISIHAPGEGSDIKY